ncbi:MAG: Zn-ribbon containing protein [Nanoarchaeota archaeon]|nr:Zn-ribbon containing protein [Nanoarchaeota archaeon]
MPHQCVRCGTFYEAGADEILKGCVCGAKLFFYIKKEKLEEAKKLAANITHNPEQKTEIEDDVLEMIGSERNPDEPVVLDFESIRILKPGQYELDLVSLFKKKPIIFRLEEGKYVIDLPESFKAMHDKKKK